MAYLEILISPRTKSINYYQILNRLTKKDKRTMKMKMKISLRIKEILLFKKYWTFIKIKRRQNYSILNAKLLGIVNFPGKQVGSPRLL